MNEQKILVGDYVTYWNGTYEVLETFDFNGIQYLKIQHTSFETINDITTVKASEVKLMKDAKVINHPNEFDTTTAKKNMFNLVNYLLENLSPVEVHYILDFYCEQVKSKYINKRKAE